MERSRGGTVGCKVVPSWDGGVVEWWKVGGKPISGGIME